MNFTKIEWQPIETEGVMQSMLYQCNTGTGRTVLMSLEAGTRTATHAHLRESEEILVLDGKFEDDDGTYGPGDYCLRPAGKTHRAWTSTGRISLVIYR